MTAMTTANPTAVATDAFGNTGSDAVTLTGSVGVSAFPAPAADAKTLVTRAFERMWEARTAGGNRVVAEVDA